MKSSGRILSLAGVACLVAAQVWAADGVQLVQKVTTGTGPAQTHQIQIEPKRMRMEAAVGPRSQVVIFDGTRDVMTILDEANKTYTEMTKADADALGEQVSSAMSQMQEAMKNMPPEQRAQIEAAMKGRGGAGRAGGMGGATASKVQYKKTGTDTVGKWTCDKYEGYTDGQKTSEICTVDPKVLGFTPADFAVTKDLAAFFQKLVPSANASQMFRIGTPEEQGFSGIPVRSVTTVAGQTMTAEITDVHRQSFPDSIFQVPAGYQKAASPFGGMGRGRRGGK
jgi:hypothetical protein